MAEPMCPACNGIGVAQVEDQYSCDNANCRVVTFHDYGQTGGMLR